LPRIKKRLKCNPNKTKSLLYLYAYSFRFLAIPGEEKFVHAFKFSTRLPKSIPTSKTMFIPLDPDRHTKHRFTKLSF